MAKNKRKKKEVEDMDLSGATVGNFDTTGTVYSSMNVPKEIIKNKAWRFDFVWDKAAGATFSTGEFCAPIVTMPDGWVDESKMINEYAGAASEEYKEAMKQLLIQKGIINE